MWMESLRLPGGPEARRLELERIKIRLRLAEPATAAGFLHGGRLQQLLTRACGDRPAPGLIPLALESGHVAYAEGDLYDFVVTAMGEDRRHLEGLEAGLRAAGRDRRRGKANHGVLFEPEKIAPLPRRSLTEAASRAAKLAEQGWVRIRLLSPLRLRQPPAATRGGLATRGEGFPASLFLGGLWRRYQELAGLPAGQDPPPLPASASIRPEALVRLDLPLEPGNQLRPGQPAPTVLGGLCGSLYAENLPQEWLLLLVLMEEAHAGTATEFGFGAYTTGELETWHRPAATYQEKLGSAEPSPQAAAEKLAPAAVALLDEGSAFYRRGLSRESAEEGLRRAREEGLNGPVGGAGDLFVDNLKEAEIMARLEALWPGEPLVQKFRGWLQKPEDKAELNRLLAKIFAVELADQLQGQGRRLVRMGSELRVLGRHATRVA